MVWRGPDGKGGVSQAQMDAGWNNFSGGIGQPPGGIGQPQQGGGMQLPGGAIDQFGNPMDPLDIARSKRPVNWGSGPYPDQMAPPGPDPRLDSSGQQQGGGTYGQDQMNLQNTFSNKMKEIQGLRSDNWQSIRDRYKKKAPPTPKIDITQEVASPPGGGNQKPWGGVQPLGQPLGQQLGQPMMGRPQVGGIGQQQQGMGRPQQQGMGRPQQQGGVPNYLGKTTGINNRTGQPGHPMGASSMAPQKQGIGRPQQQGGMPGNVGGGTKRPTGVPPGLAGGTPRGY